jgi:ribosomal protein S18 acetylase RimI-like enzyme
MGNMTELLIINCPQLSVIRVYQRIQAVSRRNHPEDLQGFGNLAGLMPILFHLTHQPIFFIVPLLKKGCYKKICTFCFSNYCFTSTCQFACLLTNRRGGMMSTAKAEIRPLQREDFDAVVAIDEKVFNRSRPEYYEIKFNRVLDEKDRVVNSLVAVADGKLVGFVMGELFVGEYGIPATTATLDTVGIHPDYQRKGVAKQLLDEFVAHLRKAGVEKINTLVNWNDWQLIRFFSANGFEPAKTINLELSV